MILAFACVAAVLASAGAFMLARRQAQAQLLPLGPTGRRGGERRRRISGRVRYLGALAVVAGLAGLLAWTVDGGTSHPPPLPGETVLLLDLSGSITTQGNQVIARTLDGFRNYPPDRRAAVVYFSSSAALGSPISSPAADLAGLARLFTSSTRTRGPWGESFDGGTIISRAVALARRVLVRAQAHHGRVVVVSDLQDNPKDLERLHHQLVLLGGTHASLALMPLPPTRQSAISLAQLSEPYRAVFGDHIIVPKPSFVAGTNGRPLTHTALLRARYPAAALLLALVLGTSALAVSFFPRLAWRLG